MSDGAGRSPARRAVEITARTGHVGAMAVVVGGYHAAAGASLRPWLVATAVTGLVLLATEASHSRHWPWQARGVLALLHTGVVLLVVVAPRSAGLALAAGLVVGSVGSHLPRSIRKYSFRHRRTLD